MKKCKRCGSIMNDDVRFCTKCDNDTMGHLSISSADVEKDETSGRLFGGAVHSARGHSCRAESVNGRNVQRFQTAPGNSRVTGKPQVKKKPLPIFIIVIMIVIGFGTLNLFNDIFLDGPQYSESYSESIDYDYFGSGFKEYSVYHTDFVPGFISPENIYINPSLGVKLDFEALGMVAKTKEEITANSGVEIEEETGRLCVPNEDGLKIYCDSVLVNEETGERIIITCIQTNGEIVNLDEFATEDSQDVAYYYSRAGFDTELDDLGETELAGFWGSHMSISAYSETLTQYTDNLYIEGDNAIIKVRIDYNENSNYTGYDIIQNCFSAADYTD